MGLFFKKLSTEQIKFLENYNDKLGTICKPCVKAYVEAMVAMEELMSICYPSRMNESNPKGVKHLIKPALNSITKYRNILIDANEKYINLLMEDWFPKKYKKQRESWNIFFELQIRCAPMVIEALSDPDPLKMWSSDKKSKLNMFVSGMNMCAMSIKLYVVTDLASQVKPNN
jgi:hypothetical protein